MLLSRWEKFNLSQNRELTFTAEKLGKKVVGETFPFRDILEFVVKKSPWKRWEDCLLFQKKKGKPTLTRVKNPEKESTIIIFFPLQFPAPRLFITNPSFGASVDPQNQFLALSSWYTSIYRINNIRCSGSYPIYNSLAILPSLLEVDDKQRLSL